jgi:hypothetical protein
MDTIQSGRFVDTNKAFVAPDVVDFHITEMNAEKYVIEVGSKILTTKISR